MDGMEYPIFREHQETNMLLWGFISKLTWKSMELENVWTIFFWFEPVKVVMLLCNQCGSSLCPFSAVLVHLETDLEILAVINLILLVVSGYYLHGYYLVIIWLLSAYYLVIIWSLQDCLTTTQITQQHPRPPVGSPWRRIRPTSNPPSAHCFQPPAEVNRWGRGWFWPQIYRGGRVACRFSHQFWDFVGLARLRRITSSISRVANLADL